MTDRIKEPSIIRPLLDRAPPHSLEAEKGVLGSLLLDPRMCDDVTPVLHSEEFYSPAYRTLFEQMVQLHNAGKPIDVTLLIAGLQASGDFEMLGGMSLLLDIAEYVPTAANAVWYAGIIRDNALKREALYALHESIRDVCDDSMSAPESLQKSQARLSEVADRRSTSQTTTLSAAISETVEALDERIRSGTPSGLPSGFGALDQKLGGLRPGELVIVAGRPGSGKTSLGLGIATFVAEKKTAGVLIVSLEMSRRELVEKMLSAKSGVDSELIREGRLDGRQRDKIDEAGVALAPLPISIEDASSRRVLDIVATARRLKRQGLLQLLVVDYLTLIEPDNGRDPRQEQVAKITRRLKTAARELQVPILCLAQLNRESERDAGNRPKLSHLRESGSIEQDADVVLFVHRPEMLKPDDLDLKGKVELIVAKNRHGSTGTVPLVWNGATASFSPAASGMPWDGGE